MPPVSRPWVHCVTALKALISGRGVNELRLSAQLPSGGSQPKVMLPGLSKKTLCTQVAQESHRPVRVLHRTPPFIKTPTPGRPRPHPRDADCRL